jgi:hypothetical protein
LRTLLRWRRLRSLTSIVSYHVNLVNRTALRKELEGAGLREFQQWKEPR